MYVGKLLAACEKDAGHEARRSRGRARLAFGRTALGARTV